MKNKYFYITLLAVLGFQAEVSAQEQRNAPRLVVNITIDQLRSDYLEAFLPLYGEKGFKLLMSQGMVYTNAAYSFAPIDRASSIAALASGVTPYYNNIVGQRWLNRETLRPVFCVDDVAFSGLNTSRGSSPKNLRTSTLGDELKVATSGRSVVYAIAPNQDAAVLAAGHAANGAFWLDDLTGDWCSSSYYFSTFPMWANAYNRLQAPSKQLQKVSWEPANEWIGSFNYFVQSTTAHSFKHTFRGDEKYEDYKTSALINEEITVLAQHCVASCGMGNDKVTDLLNLTYYAGTFKHQRVTDCQIELQDTYVRLDQEIGRLITFLEERFGKDKIMVVLTSTGYNDEMPPDYQSFHIPSGTFYLSRSANLLNMYLGGIWGQGKYVESYYRNQIYLNHQLLEAKKISLNDATRRSQEILVMMSGVQNVYTALQLLTDNSEQLRKIRNGFNAELCGDLVIETSPGWTLLNEDTQESEIQRAAFVPFPIIFYGTGIDAEQINIPVTTDRIAPTIAKSIRIRAPNACAAAPLF